MRIKVASVIILILFAVTAANYILGLTFTRQSMAYVMENELNLALDIADTAVATKIGVLESNAETVAEQLMNAGSPSEMTEVMKSRLEEFSEFASFTVYDRNGIVANYGQTFVQGSLTDESRYIQSAFDGITILTIPDCYGENNEPFMRLFVPMRKGMVLSASIPGLFFSDFISQYKLWQTGSIFMIDANGGFVASHNELYPDLVSERQNFIIMAETEPEFESVGSFFREILTNRNPGSGRYNYDGKERLCVYKCVTNPLVNWRIVIAAPFEESPQINVQKDLLITAILFLIAGIIASIFISGFAVKPFLKIEVQNRNLEKLNETVQTQAEKIRIAHERTTLLLDATPLACRLWNRDYKIFECNYESVRLFSLKDKAEYMEKYFDLSPEYQPDGNLSRTKIIELLRRVLEGEEESCTFEWMHKKLDGTLIPCEITHVRVKYGDEYVVAGYTRDLREQKRMMGEIKHRDDLLSAGNHSASVLLSTVNDENYEESVIESMGYIGKYINVDRIYIWRNVMIDGDLNYKLLCEWLNDTGYEGTPVDSNAVFSYLKYNPEWREKFLRDECVNGPLSELSESDQRVLSMYGMKSILVIPILLHDVFWGFVSFEDCRDERYFTKDEVEILRSAGLMMAYAVNHSEQTANIRHSYDYAELFLDAMPLSGCIIDKNMNLIKCNEGALRLFELTDRQEFIDHFYDFSPEFQPDGRLSKEASAQNVWNAFDEGKCVFEWMHQLKDGTPLPTEITIVRIAYGGDYVVAAYVRDLREQKRMMAEIEQHGRLMSKINETASILLKDNTDTFKESIIHCMGIIGNAVGVGRVGIWKNHIDGGALHCTELFEWLVDSKFRVGAEFTVDVPYGKLMPRWAGMLSAGEYINSLLCDAPDEEQAYLARQGVESIFLSPVFVEENFWGFVEFDMFHEGRVFTESEQSILHSSGILLVNALLRNEMMINLQTANRAKSDFLAKMSHEMRTPLNAIVGLSGLALEDEAILAETRLNIEKVNNAGAILLTTVNDILDISKIEAGMLTLSPVTYDIPSLLNDAVTQSIMHKGEKPIEFILNIVESLPSKLYGDDLRIKQIFNNLLSNAFKYTMEGTVELGVRCSREGEETIWLTAWVRDTGIGIKTEHIDRLFDEFVQANVHANRNIMGTGLGLSITKKLAELMGGTIAMESEYGKGSTFTVKLMQKFVTDEQIGTEVMENLKSFRYSDQKRRKNSKLVRIKLPGARVLVVDDNITNLDVARGLLKPYEMGIDCMTDGQQAIDVIRKGKVKYDVVLMDHMMPGMDGIEATRRIREIGTDYAKTIPIIACTANAIVGNKEMFLSNGFQDFISKPIEIVRLDEIIRLWVHDKSTENTESQIDDKKLSIKKPGLSIKSFNIEGVDLKKGLLRFGDDEEVYVSILHSYIVNTRPILERIKKVDKNDLYGYSIDIHGLKSSTLGICAEDASNTAKELEDAANSGNYDFVNKNNPGFIKTAEKLISDLEILLGKIDAANSKTLKDKPGLEMLERLMAACNAYDMDGVDEAMAEIESFKYESDDGLIAWLRENVLQVNFTQIIEKLSTLIAQLKL